MKNIESNIALSTTPEQQVDLREQLFNAGEIGPIHKNISTPKVRITQLNGIMFDLDLKLYRRRFLRPGDVSLPRPTPEAFYTERLAGWLDGHALLRNAEVRCSGNGLHVLLWMEPAIVFSTEAERDAWTAIVRLIQTLLPIDPEQPDIQAMTRPLGSINGKNGKTVTQLRKGIPVAPEVLREWGERINKSPFKSLVEVLAGSEKMTPCPICKLADKTLVAGDYLGRCYQCDVVGLEQLLDGIYLPQKPVEKKPMAVVSRKAKPAPKPALKPPNVKPKVPGPLSSAFPNRHGSNQFSISRAVKPGVVARKAVANG